MATDDPGRDIVKSVCPLRCRLRHGAAGDDPVGGQAPATDEVDWAGLPINLDYAFSQAKRDKVYLQHVHRKRRAQPWRWFRDGAQPCVCEMTAGHQPVEPGAARSMTDLP